MFVYIDSPVVESEKNSSKNTDFVKILQICQFVAELHYLHKRPQLVLVENHLKCTQL